MVVAAAILTTFFGIELATAIAINSIALLADAGHLLTDLAALFMGVTAVVLTRRGSTSPSRTYGWHRAEVFTAVANAVLLIGVATFIATEAIRRIGTAPDVPGMPLIVVALAGWRSTPWSSGCCGRTRSTAWRCAAPTWRWSPTPSATSRC